MFFVLISWSGLDIGLDRGTAVLDYAGDGRYLGPFPFTGDLRKVVIDLRASTRSSITALPAMPSSPENDAAITMTNADDEFAGNAPYRHAERGPLHAV
ncbi:MAG: hypothetical protein R2706_02655 [Acidimicrobiales bacterium]